MCGRTFGGQQGGSTFWTPVNMVQVGLHWSSASLAVGKTFSSCGTVVHAQGGFKFHQYQVVGRHLPTEAEPNPAVYRMKVWAEDGVKAKSKFW